MPELEKIKDFTTIDHKELENQLINSVKKGKKYYTTCYRGGFVSVLTAILELYFEDEPNKDKFLGKVSKISNVLKKRKIFVKFVKTQYLNLMFLKQNLLLKT